MFAHILARKCKWHDSLCFVFYTDEFWHCFVTPWLPQCQRIWVRSFPNAVKILRFMRLAWADCVLWSEESSVRWKHCRREAGVVVDASQRARGCNLDGETGAAVYDGHLHVWCIVRPMSISVTRVAKTAEA